MNQFGRLATALGMATLILCIAPKVSAVDYNYRPSHYTFALRGGFIYGSNLDIYGANQYFNGQFTIDTELGLSAGILFDFPITRNYVAGLAFDLHDIQVEEIRKKFLDISLSAKRVFQVTQSNFSIRAGGAIGFGYLGPDFGGFHWEHTTYLTVKATVEGVFPINVRYAWIIDISVLRVPTGGNHELRGNFGPTVIGRVGILM